MDPGASPHPHPHPTPAPTLTLTPIPTLALSGGLCGRDSHAVPDAATLMLTARTATGDPGPRTAMWIVEWMYV